MSIDPVLLPELIGRIGASAGSATSFALRYVSKTTHAAMQLYAPELSPYDMIIDAIGNPDMIRWLFSMGCTAKNIYAWQDTLGELPPDTLSVDKHHNDKHHNDKHHNDKVCAMAARRGDLESLQLLRKNGFLVHKDDLKYAIRHDNVKLIKYLLQEPTTAVIDEDFLSIVVVLECYNLLSWADDTGRTCYWPWHNLLCTAAASGSVKMLRWCTKKFLPSTNGLVVVAAYNGHLPVVKWLHDRYEREGIDTSDSAIRAARAGGHEHIIEWFRSVCIDVNDASRGYIIYPVAEFRSDSDEFILNKYAGVI